MDQIDLSRATKLKEVAFELETHYTAAVAATLDRITPKHQDFKQISLYFPCLFLSRDFRLVDFRTSVGEEIYSQWVDLDRILVRLWESHAIRMKVICNVREKGPKVTHDDMKYLFCGMATKERIELELIYKDY